MRLPLINAVYYSYPTMVENIATLNFINNNKPLKHHGVSVLFSLNKAFVVQKNMNISDMI